jgi:alanyl-tRNA synthetase
LTHLLLSGLREVLGVHVHQRGSNITSERIRFDFSHSEKVTREQLDKVEEYVENALRNEAHVSSYKMEKKEAQDSGVEGSFWDKYPETVTIYEIKGIDGTVYSRELCGGPHVENITILNELGRFRITKEQSSSAGVRRITAVMI